MRRSVILFVAAWLLLFPFIAQAQSAVAFEKLDIQFWPDYDRPSVLVIYNFIVSADTSLPAQVRIRMPAGAQLFAVARDENGSLINVEHDLPQQVGNYSLLVFSVVDRSLHRVEFYVPYVQQEQKRTFIYTWPGDYPVASLQLILQEPVGVTDLMTEPPMTNLGPGPDGFTYHSLTAQDVKEGESLSFKASYYSKNSALSTERPQFSDTLEPSLSFVSFLPWILGGLGVALILAGGVWYWLSGRSGGDLSGHARKRHSSQVEDEPAESVYCSQCGKRAQPGDRFCRACGSKLRQ